jgi:isoquinoline 1-oxidoreductase beta subunit
MTTKSRLVTRRQFLITGLAVGGGLAIGYGVSRLDDGDAAQKFVASTPDSFALNAWIKIAPSGEITFAVHRAEMGQGVSTSLPMMLAEELDADWSMVRYEFAPVDKDYFNFGIVGRGRPFGDTEERFWAAAGTWALRRVFHVMGLSMTISSSSIIDAYDTLRPAGAAARDMLIAAAAKKWGIPKDILKTENGSVIDESGRRRASYGELAEAAAQERPPSDPTLKDPKDYRIVGTNIPRLDVHDKVAGSAVFGTDITLPDMLYATVKHAPVFNSKIKNYNPNPLLEKPGVEKVVPIRDDTIAVIARSTWQAMEAMENLEVSYTRGPSQPADSATLFGQYQEALDDQEPSVFRDDGNTQAALTNADLQVEAVYGVPFLAHLCMEPMNCTALVSDAGVEVWVPTQANTLAHKIAAEAAGVNPDKVIVNSTLIGGAFGRRAETDFVQQAVTLAKEVPGRPVKLIWSREEDLQHDAYRPAALCKMQGGLDREGNLQALESALVTQSVVASYNQRTPTARGGNAKKDRGVSSGIYNMVYPLPNMRVTYSPQTLDVPVGYWRSVGSSHGCFFLESFIDELSHASGEDPLAFRMRLLHNQPRHLKVLEEAALRAGWEKPVAPGCGRGIAITDNHGTIVAEIVKVSVGNGGKLSVEEVICVVNCRQVIHPDTVIAQMEGSILDGLSAALYGQITLTQGQVDQSNFSDYRFLNLAEAPKVSVHVIPEVGRPGGIGEPGLPPIAPALANAIFSATGRRIRYLPISNQTFLRV